MVVYFKRPIKVDCAMYGSRAPIRLTPEPPTRKTEMGGGMDFTVFVNPGLIS